MDILDILNGLNIKFHIIEHKPIYTTQDSYIINNLINGKIVKSLFLKDNSENYYIYILDENKRADFKLLKEKIGKRLEFASPEELYQKMKLTSGSVSPLGIINDNGSIIILIDKDIVSEKILSTEDIVKVV